VAPLERGKKSPLGQIPPPPPNEETKQIKTKQLNFLFLKNSHGMDVSIIIVI
jgi:hypothetical protein